MHALADSSTKHKVMDAALRVFADCGYAASSIRDIADRAGVTKPMVYYHYGSKAGLYQALLDDCLDGSLRAMQEAAQGGRVRDRLVRFINAMLGWASANRDRIRVVVQMYSTAEGQLPSEIKFKDRLLARYEWMRALIQSGIECGEFTFGNADLMALSIMGQTHFMMISMLVFDAADHPANLPPADQLAEAIVELFIGGAGRLPDAGAAPGGRGLPTP